MTMTFTIDGNLTRQPKFEQYGGDKTLVRLGVASDRWVHGEDGARKTIAEFYDVTLFGAAAEQFREADKGDAVHISGHVRPNRYLKDGVEMYGHNFIGNQATVQLKKAAETGPPEQTVERARAASRAQAAESKADHPSRKAATKTR